MDPNQPELGYPLARSGWDTLIRPGQDGTLPQPGQDDVHLPPRTGYAWTGYAMGSTHFAFSRRGVSCCCVVSHHGDQ